MRYDLDIENCKTFNEKLQWIKLHDRNPEYTQMLDKFEAPKYVTHKIGKEYIISILGVFDTFDIKFARNILGDKLKRNYYWAGREWQYKDVKPRIIDEEMLEEDFLRGNNRL